MTMPLHHNLTSLYGGTGTLAMSGDGTQHTNTVVSIRSSKSSEIVAMLREAIEYLGGGHYTRTDDPVDPEGDDTRTREHLLAEEHRLLGLEKSLRAHLSRTINRAEKAEKERDDLRAQIEADSDVNYLLREDRDAWKAKAEQPRPLTPDDITDAELYGEGLRQAGRGKADELDRLTVWMMGAEWSRKRLSPRPEGAEELADDMEDCLRDVKLEDVGLDGLADRLATLGYRKDVN